jgi:hypothetical protein
MSGPKDPRRAAALVLSLWALSAWVTAFHSHDCCCGSVHEDDPPCSICVAVKHVPLTAVTKTETFERGREVIAWISPWIALVPADVFFDRPLARGPPASS